ncbi:spermidine synthase [Thalassiella azotivora]
MSGRAGRRPGRPAGGRPAPTPPEGRHEVDTGTVELVPDTGDPRLWTLLLNGVPSSSVHLDDPTLLDFEYLRWMADALDLHAPADHPLDVLHLGGAGCALPRYVHAVRPGSRQVVVEVDAALARLVREWFDLPRSPALRIQVGDARERLAARRAASADVVVRDVFAGDSTPSHVTTVEFVRDVARVMRPGGLYLANVADRPPLEGLRGEVAAVRDVLPHVAVVAETAMLRGRRYANAVVAASDAPLPVGGLTRRVAAGAVPARVVAEDDVDGLVGRTPPRTDP